MDTWGKLLGLGSAALVLYGITSRKKANKEKTLKVEEENKRANTTFIYPSQISSNDFDEIVYKSIKPIKNRIKTIHVCNGIVTGTVVSITGLSEWTFTLDFNDYGSLTGRFWVKTENSQSNIPQRLGTVIKMQVEKLLFDMDTINAVLDEYADEYRDEVERETSTITTPIFEKPNTALKHKKFILIVFLISIVLIFGSYAYYEYQKLIPIGYDEVSLVGLDYNKVVEKLENQGFTYVSTENISDLSLDEETNANLVTDIRLEEKPVFDKETKYSYDKRIVVVYHSLKLCNAPITSKDAKGTNYTDVMDKFKDVGFINVKTNIIYDIITGWVIDDGEVKSVTIDGNEVFDTYDEYRPDAEVVITYHTYKKNDPNK